MTLQYIIIGVTLLIAVLYAVCRIRDILRRQSDPCASCDGCALKGKVKGCQQQALRTQQKHPKRCLETGIAPNVEEKVNKKFGYKK